MSDDDEDSKAAERGTYYDRTGGRGPANIGWHNDLAKSRKETNELGIRKAEYKNAIGAAIEYGDFVTMENKKLEKLLVIGRQRIADLKNIKHGLERDVNKYIQKHFKQYDDVIFDLEAKLEEMKAENAELKKKSAAVE
jgi:predicted RNase H-like nuclease (RuvC/YqgF family)